MATTCTVTATITDPSGSSLLGNSFIRFRLRNFTGSVPQVSGTCVIVEDTIDAYPSPAGAISQILTCNTAISPVNTFYSCEMWNQGRIISSANYIFNANTSLNTASPVNPAPAPAGPGSIVFENNGVLNSSQTLLNLESTDSSVTVTDLGGGNINLQSSGKGVTTAGLGGFWGAGKEMETFYGTSQSAANVNTSNVVDVFQFVLQNSYTISRVSCIVSGASGNTANFGIYDQNGNKLLDSGAMSMASLGQVTSTITSVALSAATVYYFAQSGSTGGPMSVDGFGLAADAIVDMMNAHGSVKIGQAANATSAGVLPATLGAITADAVYNNMAAVFFQV